MLSAIQGGKDTERSDIYFRVPDASQDKPIDVICRDMYFLSDSKINLFESFLAKRQFLSSADNLCKQCGPRSGPTKCLS